VFPVILKRFCHIMVDSVKRAAENGIRLKATHVPNIMILFHN
jgi:hypothetical protein